uniref:Glycosyltransferase n=1 Tax=Caldiarchaeum subterraneum TaxID=311458 RepID=A0A7C5Y7D3_CALS0
MHIGVCSQTPLVRIKNPNLLNRVFFNLSELKEDVDYVFSPGGVTRMLYPLLKRLIRTNLLESAVWVSLNPHGPEKITIGNIELNYVKIHEPFLKGYGAVKEAFWNLFHGMFDSGKKNIIELVWQEDYADYNLYNRLCSELLKKADKEKDFDVFYVHDFQQLPTGKMLSTVKPKIFRWHIPFNHFAIPAEWRDYLLKYFEAYDAVVVSSSSYENSLRKLGYTNKIYRVYPYIDFEDYVQPSKGEVQAFCDKYGIREDDFVVAMVARLDPLKGHDIAIQAVAKCVKHIPNIKLLIVGNGSFSSSSQGLKLSKAERWKEKLVELVALHGLDGRVVFTGHVNSTALGAAYERCALTVLPSKAEGFGLVVVESWLYGKPPLVSANAGIAELVKNGTNGFVIRSVDELAEAITKLAKDEKLRQEIGDRSLESAMMCSIERGMTEESRVLREVIEG